MPKLLDKLRADFNTVQDQLREMDAEFADRDDDPNEAELDNQRALNEELEKLLPRIQIEAERAERLQAGADLLNKVPADLDDRLDATHRRAIQTEARTWGEHVRARALGEYDSRTVEEFHDATRHLEQAHARSFSRALADVTTADVPGIVPPQYLTEIVDFIGTARPFVSAFSTVPLPDTGMTVSYPTVTIKPQVAKQASQKTEVASRKTNITSTSVDVETWGGGEDVSIQVLQRTDPGYLGIMMELYAEEMATQTDTAAITAALDATTAAGGANEVTVDSTDVKLINATMTGVAKTIYSARARPSAVVLGLDLWEFLAGAVDSEGRPLLPDISPVNPVGHSDLSTTNGVVRGLTWVVDPNMPPERGIVGWDRAFLTMLGGMQSLSADVPSRLGRDYAVFEMGAFAVRRPGALVGLTLT